MKLIVVIAFLFAVNSVPAFAQENVVRPLNLKRLAIGHTLAVLIDDMERACKLSEAQTKQLKEVAREATSSKKETIAMRQREVVRKHDRSERKLDSGNEMFIELRNVELEYDVTEERSWIDGVKRIVTKDQLEKYDSVVDGRLARKRQAAVSVFMARVDMELLLSDKQRADLTVLVDEGFGAELAKEPKDFSYLRLDDAHLKNDAQTRIKYSALKSVFSDTQFAMWKQFEMTPASLLNWQELMLIEE